ncbi:GNAT family N-acetyltransferase [Desulfopila sp. IMCC35008]|uniref:GNAT family N-acetyltransferase n=1 Tax=Desulfopila sp. IMCC35008 TaxID=2653858 RepID=UPI0013D72927|nr:N-acetyltransferase [Desulfopila sp. IMCC35008]
MKIRALSPDDYPKVSALLKQTFPEGDYEVRLVENLHRNGKPLHEWICIHRNKAIAYIAYSRAFHGTEVCGLHLAPLAVSPQMQNQGIGTELLNFSLRQEEIKRETLFVLGDPRFYKRFGFEHCSQPVCPFDINNKHFLAIRNTTQQHFTIGYEKEFTTGH